MKIFNSLTRTKEDFVPINENEVKIYACGPTVYSYIHIGNARPIIVFDALRRYLEYIGFSVKFVQNFTDIDDKMINKANEGGITVKELADRFISEYFVDSQGLNVREASIHPKATENIDAIIEIITKLINNGFAYESNGDVYFSTKTFADYGKLSHQPLEDLESGARIDVNEQKKDAMDFALWKAKKPGEPAWESPWGVGRPGWHIECSAMANKYLAETIDIHGGGQDLVFPHHENEVAQSEAANGKPLANYWMHNGHINVDNRKMSKSLGNFFTVREISEQYEYEVIRFFMLSVHYRNPVNFSKDLMEQAKSSLTRLYTCIENMDFLIKNATEKYIVPDERELLSEIMNFKEDFIAAMDDDLNTAKAISVLFDMVKLFNTAFTADSGYCAELIKKSKDLLLEFGNVLGILTRKKEVGLDREIDQLICERQEARTAKNWAKSDEIRDKLLAMDIILEDTPMGVKWKRK